MMIYGKRTRGGMIARRPRTGLRRKGESGGRWHRYISDVYMVLVALFSPIHGAVAQMVERALSMREVRGSIPRSSKKLFLLFFFPTSTESFQHRLRKLCDRQGRGGISAFPIGALCTCVKEFILLQKHALSLFYGLSTVVSPFPPHSQGCIQNPHPRLYGF